MADLKTAAPENSPGRFFVDDTCIRCAACWKEAPNHFVSHPVECYAFVSRQPETAAEVEACRRALKICPVNAIGERL